MSGFLFGAQLFLFLPVSQLEQKKITMLADAPTFHACATLAEDFLLFMELRE